jgi:serine/threonine protein kinase
MKDVMRAHDNHDMLFKLHCLLPPPEEEWLSAHFTPAQRAHTTLPADPELAESVRARQIQITVSEEQLVLVKDLASSILKWDAKQRPTMAEVLKHPFFESRVVAPVPQHSEDPLRDAPLLWRYQPGEKIWTIHWRDRSEKEFIQREVKAVYAELLKTEWPDTEQWLLDDVVVLAKRIVDRLKIMETTFDVKHLIRVCCEFCFFVWKNYWPEEDPLFESSMFHLLNLLRFNVMAFNVKEVFVHEASIAAEHAATPPSAPQPQAASTSAFSFSTDLTNAADPPGFSNLPGSSAFTITLANGNTLELQR